MLRIFSEFGFELDVLGFVLSTSFKMGSEVFLLSARWTEAFAICSNLVKEFEVVRLFLE